MSVAAGFSRSVLWGSVLLVLLVLAAGCAALDVPDPLAPDVAGKRRRRTDEVAQEFESRRDRAELQAALEELDRGELDASERRVRCLLERNPRHLGARRLMAQLRLADDPSHVGIARVEEMPPPRSQDADVEYATGLLLEATGQGENALAYYERASELEPDSELHSVDYRTALRSGGRTRQSDAEPPQVDDTRQVSQGPILAAPAGVVRDSERASSPAEPRSDRPTVAAPPDQPAQPVTTLRLSVREESSAGANPADAAEASETEYVDVVRRKARAATVEDPTGAALTSSEETAAIGSDNPQTPIAEAIQALRHGRPELAIELLLPAEHHHRGPAQLYRILGVAYYRLGDYESSEVALRQALSLDKSSALSYFLMGCTLSKRGQFEAAEDHFEQARTLNPRYTVRR